MRASLKSILSVTLLSIAIAAFAQHGVAIPNAPPSRILADAHNQNADVIVFERAPEKTGAGPECDIYSVNADGTGEKALTHDGHSHSPSWSSDGRHILFVHDAPRQTGPPNKEDAVSRYHPIELYVMDRDGGNPHLIQRFEAGIFQAAWSPDGTAIVVYTTDGTPGSPPGPYLYLVSPDGRGTPRLLFSYVAGQPAWSPDGKRILFARRSELDCAPNPDPIPAALRALVAQIPCWPWTPWFANADGSNATRLLVKNNISYPQVWDPAWSPDGRQIAFRAAVDSSWSTQIFVMNEDGSEVRQLTNDSGWVDCEHPSWRADGLQIAFSCKPRWTFCAEHDDAGRPMIPWCVRRLFVVPTSIPANILTPLNENNGSLPAFAPK